MGDYKDKSMKKMLPVDAGNISVADLDYYKERGGDLKYGENDPCYLVIKVQPGMYKADIYISDTYLGDIKDTFIVETNGTIVVSDACYCFDETWMAFLKETQYLVMQNSKFMCFDTGGDGEFEVEIELDLIKEKS